MLFVLFGQCGVLSQKSREFFIGRGFEYIQKYTYVPEGTPCPSSKYGDRVYVDLQTIYKRDFRYENNGRIIGFDQKQISDALQGRKNCLLTLAPDNIDFLTQIKNVCGDSVTAIFTYISDETIKYIYNVEYDYEQEEREKRILVGSTLKRIYLKNKDFFDETVIYNGEDSVFNLSAVMAQYDDIIKKSVQRETLGKSRKLVDLPYMGNKPYVFVSYSHEDADKVVPVLRQLQLRGFRVWFDKGIQGGKNWRKMIAIRLSGCEKMLLFSSENSVKSIHVRAELNAMLNILGKDSEKLITVRMDESTFSLEYEMYIQTCQHFLLSDVDLSENISCALGDAIKE